METRLNAADLYVIHDVLYESLKIVNYHGKFHEETRQNLMDKIMDILAYTEVNITPETIVESNVSEGKNEEPKS
jgi:hypothetical protein